MSGGKWDVNKPYGLPGRVTVKQRIGWGKLVNVNSKGYLFRITYCYRDV